MKVRAYRIARRLLYRFVIPAISRMEPIDGLAARITKAVARLPVLSPSIVSPIQVNGLTIFHREDRPSFTVRSLAMGAYEPAVVDALKARLELGMHVLDVGAHIGYHTLVSCRLVGAKGHVWAFEPDPDNLQLLRQNVLANQMVDRVTVVPTSVSSRSGMVKLQRVHHDSGSSTITGLQSDLPGVDVPTTTLDAWAARNGWPEIDLIKMDIEGSEPDALAGMTELARRNPAVALIVECQSDALERGGSESMRLFARLYDLGFNSIVVLDDYGAGQSREHWTPAGILRRSRWYPINLWCTKERSRIS